MWQAAATLLLIVASASAVPDSAKTVYIFYPSTMRPAMIQQKFVAVCGGAKVTAFGRFQDFKEKTVADHPDLVITKPQVLAELSGYSVRLAGVRKGSTVEPWVLVSIEKPVPPDSLSKITLGTIDFLGRANTEQFVDNLIHTTVRLNRVTKIEDLLPMLNFNKARAAIVAEGAVAYFKKTSQLNIIVSNVPECSAGIVTCAEREQDKDPATKALIRIIAQKTPELLEIDQWKPVLP